MFKTKVMIFTSYSKTDKYYEFVTAEGCKFLAPLSSIILVDDQSGSIAIKTVASRKTIGVVPKNI